MEDIRYISTRGGATPCRFSDVVLDSLACDGGLYLPDRWPAFSADDIEQMQGSGYGEIAQRIISRFTGSDFPQSVLNSIIDHAYGPFNHSAVTPLAQIAPNQFLLELWHGPTLAFKDVAMRFLAGAIGHALARRKARATILCATSGDTGSAAIDAFAGVPGVSLFVLFPDGNRISEVQRRQMTCCAAKNTHALAIEGTFDDCQDIVKALFSDPALRGEMPLVAVNSINWARILAQIVYYFVAAIALGAPGRKVSFTVPTGNFGNIYAAFVAKKLGLPIDKLIVASNKNDILVRAINNGDYVPRMVHSTIAPSMDIQIASNFERLLYDALGEDGPSVNQLMGRLKSEQGLTLDPALARKIRTDFQAGRAGEEEINSAMAHCWLENGYILDPHSAAGYHVAQKFSNPEVPMVLLSTAHPAKFAQAVEAACGAKPELPEALARRLQEPERVVHLPANKGAVEAYLRSASAMSS